LRRQRTLLRLRLSTNTVSKNEFLFSDGFIEKMSSTMIDFLEMEVADLKSQLAWYREENKKLRTEVQRKNAEMTSLELRSAEIIKNAHTLRTEVRDAFIRNDKLW